MHRLFLAAWVLSIAAAAQPRVDEGEIAGAPFRIDLPERWNGSLLMFCHGYGGSVQKPPQNATVQEFLKRGWAVAQSEYSARGWAVEEGVRDTEALRRHFVEKYGKPKRTVISGLSMGGHITAASIERSPEIYDGAMPLCAVLAPALQFFERRAFDMLVVFDFYFPGELPPAAAVPAEYRLSKEGTARLTKVLAAKPKEAEAVRRFAGIRLDPELAFVLDFSAAVLAELRVRAGGNAFDNTTTIYDGVPDVEALNDGAKRYAADANATEYVRTRYGLTGDVRKPVLSVHTTYDVLVPVWVPTLYSSLVEQQGAERNFSQQYVKRNGHCTFRPEEVGRGFDQLVEWIDKGTKPLSGALPIAPPDPPRPEPRSN